MIRLFLVTLISLSGSAFGVNTFFMSHNSEEQFKKGKAENVLIDSQGTISLAYDSKDILEAGDDDWVVNDIAIDSDGTLYVATSGKGNIYKITSDGTSSSIWSEEGHSRHIFSLAILSDGSIVAGTGGDKAGLYKYDGSSWKEIWANDEVKYIWDIECSKTDVLYFATGPEGKIYSVDSNGGNDKEIYDAKASNILSLLLSDDGRLYAGTDTHGLVYCIDLATGNTTVAYDTGHDEVSSLEQDTDGNIYIATSDSAGARPGAKLVLSIENDVEKNAKEGEKAEDNKDKQPPATDKPERAKPNKNGGSNGKKNTVFMLSPAGFVEMIFVGPVAIHDIALGDNGKLYLATGVEGKMICLDIETRESVVVYDSESKHISALAINDGRVYAGCADKAALVTVELDYVAEGELVSDVFDASQPATWGLMYMKASEVSGVKLAVRTGNTSDPEKGGWSDWSDAEISLPAVTMSAPVGRFLQYKLDLSVVDGATPTVSEVKASFSIPNLRPRIAKLDINIPPMDGKVPASELKKYQIRWQAVDANKDELAFDIYIKSVTQNGWIRIAKKLTESQYIWDTLNVPDGMYNIKLVASDEMSNSVSDSLTDSEISDLILIDSTAPQVNVFDLEADGGIYKTTVKVTDNLSVIESVTYSMDSDDFFRAASPVDGLADSMEETYSFELDPEDAGLHFVTIKVKDIAGNTRIISQEFSN